METTKRKRMSAEDSKRLGEFILSHHTMSTGDIVAATGFTPMEVGNWKTHHVKEMLAVKAAAAAGKPAQVTAEPAAEPKAEPAAKPDDTESLRAQLENRTKEYDAMVVDYEALLTEKDEMLERIKALTEENRALVKAREILTEQVERQLKENAKLKEQAADKWTDIEHNEHRADYEALEVKYGELQEEYDKAIRGAEMNCELKLKLFIAEKYLREEGVLL